MISNLFIKYILLAILWLQYWNISILESWTFFWLNYLIPHELSVSKQCSGVYRDHTDAATRWGPAHTQKHKQLNVPYEKRGEN